MNRYGMPTRPILALMLGMLVLPACSQDPVPAELRLAAEQGDASAQHKLGLMYGNGEGVLEDPIQAYLWVNLAASAGFQRAVQPRDLIAEQMTPEDIAEAQRLAREWKPKDSGSQ